MVRFNDTSDHDNSGTGGGTDNGTTGGSNNNKAPIEFSWLAFKVWITTGIILTTICLGSSWAWRRVETTRRKHGSFRKSLFTKKREVWDNKLWHKEEERSPSGSIHDASGSQPNHGQGSSHKRKGAGLGINIASTSVTGSQLITSPALDSGTTVRASPAGSYGQWSLSGRGSSHARKPSTVSQQGSDRPFRASGRLEDSPV